MAKPVWRIEFYNFTILVCTIWLIDYKGGKVQLKNIFNSINAHWLKLSIIQIELSLHKNSKKLWHGANLFLSKIVYQADDNLKFSMWGNQQPDCVTRWHHGSQIYFAAFN